MTYTRFQQLKDSLDWAEFKHEQQQKMQSCQGKHIRCIFEGVVYPNVAAAERAVGHSRSWLRNRGLSEFKK